MISKSVQLAKEDISKEMSIFISRDMIARFERDGNDCTKSSPEGRMVQILPPQPSKGDKKDIAAKSLDFSRLFRFFGAKFLETKMKI